MICASRVISFIGLLALAASLPLSEREEHTTAWAPRIIYPSAGVEWCVGDSHHVYWDTSNIPAQDTNAIFNLYLVVDGTFDPQHPLAQNFPLDAGVVTITVPNVPPGKYEVDLYGGESGEGWSQFFQIKYC